MPFPSRAEPTCTTSTKQIHLRDRGKGSTTLTLKSEKRWTVRQTHPESCAKAGELSCDWLLEILVKKSRAEAVIEKVFVELKARHGLEKAVKQLQATIQRMDPGLRTYPKRSYAVGHFSKPSQTRVRLADKFFQGKYRSRFEAIRGNVAVPLCAAG